MKHYNSRDQRNWRKETDHRYTVANIALIAVMICLLIYGYFNEWTF